MSYRFLFGPVPSRRLGLSLGVDIVPFKTCSFNCIYCECGKTNSLTAERKEYVPAVAVIRELETYLSTGPRLDYITFSGGGEPTLNSAIGSIAGYLKKERSSYRTALLTNGSFMNDPRVRQDISSLNLVIPSLDAVSQDIFEEINRPCAGIKVSDIIEGIRLFRNESNAELWVEFFVVPGVNDTGEELKKIKDALLSIDPDMVHLNSLDRPGTESGLEKPSRESLERIVDFLRPLKTEIIGAARSVNAEGMSGNELGEEIMRLISRRPCTEEDLNKVFPGKNRSISEYLQQLENSGKIFTRRTERGTFYSIKEQF